ncbi:hypothetical protein SAMN05660895_1013 [Thermoflavifilum thermophilum]|uniref:Uncharacterized protein n=1 Tax=Thermoflavifilum thermophilum TaxID=1393122 RepID=A0A1I7N951_9BACT|nr:hypothetical protein SAMN05660895_1013 [Thermoflavifilum thermophilum]
MIHHDSSPQTTINQMYMIFADTYMQVKYCLITYFISLSGISFFLTTFHFRKFIASCF